MYPQAAYPWLLFRREWIDEKDSNEKRGSSRSAKRSLLEDWLDDISIRRQRTLPKRYRDSKHFNLLMSEVKRYHNVLCSPGSNFFVARAVAKDMGVGVFAAAELREGEYCELAGVCHKVTKKQKLSLERKGETSFTFSSKRMEYLAGPLSLVNHACPPRNNACYAAWSDDPTPGHKSVGLRLLRKVSIGEEILVDYGEDWWKGYPELQCRCGCNSERTDNEK